MKKLTQWLAMVIIFVISFFCANAQEDESKKYMEIYGAIMLDVGYDFGQMNPTWYDVMRPTKILNDAGSEFQPQGTLFMGVRQTRFGVKNYFNTGLGKVKTVFEFDLFGSGNDAGQTAFHLRHAYAELGKFGFGQTNSLFMDGDIFPNTLEFWGPNAMPAFRNIQIRYMPVSNGKGHFYIAPERPGATSDQGQYGTGFEYAHVLDNVAFRFSVPDISAQYRYERKWGYVQLGGIVRSIKWVDSKEDQFNLSGSAIGWGLNVSTNIKLGQKTVFKCAVTGGEGIQNYMNDADADIGIKRQYDNPVTQITGEVIPMLGFVAFLDINWNEKSSSTWLFKIM